MCIRMWIRMYTYVKCHCSMPRGANSSAINRFCIQPRLCACVYVVICIYVVMYLLLRYLINIIVFLRLRWYINSTQSMQSMWNINSNHTVIFYVRRRSMWSINSAHQLKSFSTNRSTNHCVTCCTYVKCHCSMTRGARASAFIQMPLLNDQRCKSFCICSRWSVPPALKDLNVQDGV